MKITATRDLENMAKVQELIRSAGELGEGQVYLLTAEVINHRTEGQNRLYHGLIIPHLFALYSEQGEAKTKEDVKKIMADKFNHGHSTTTLSREAFNVFIMQVWQHALEDFGFAIPLPGELPNE